MTTNRGPHAPSRPERMTACARIASRLRYRPLTSLEVMELGGMNYRARISDMRRSGWTIVCRPHPTKKRTNIYIALRMPRAAA